MRDEGKRTGRRSLLAAMGLIALGCTYGEFDTSKGPRTEGTGGSSGGGTDATGAVAAGGQATAGNGGVATGRGGATPSGGGASGTSLAGAAGHDVAGAGAGVGGGIGGLVSSGGAGGGTTGGSGGTNGGASGDTNGGTGGDTAGGTGGDAGGSTTSGAGAASGGTGGDTNGGAGGARCGLDTNRQSGSQGALVQIDGSAWGDSGVPDTVTMHLYVPGEPLSRPPILVACHPCSMAASAYVGSIPGIVQAADNYGFLIVFPETSRTCWDAGSSASLTHDGGGDTEAIARMVRYTLAQYNGDADRVYVMGGSVGAVMAQALLAVYPDIFKAGVAKSGAPAGCWADGYDPSSQWSGNCATGNTTMSGRQWAEVARGMYSTYDGPRPRVQLFHGNSDTIISPDNLDEAIKQWTILLNLSTTPTSNDIVGTYTRESWENDCGHVVLDSWLGQGGHSIAYEEDAILAFLGLDRVRCLDPEEETCSGG